MKYAILLLFAMGAYATPNDHPSNEGVKLYNMKEVREATGYTMVSCQYKKIECEKVYDPTSDSPDGWVCKEPIDCEKSVVSPEPLPDECKQ